MNKDHDSPLPDASEKSADNIAENDNEAPALPLLKLENLREQYIVPPGEHPYLMHRAMICLDSQGHKSGVPLSVIAKSLLKIYTVTWEEELTNRIKDAVSDLIDAVEKSALAFAFLVVKDCTGMSVVRQAKRKTGFDYFLGQESDDDRLIFKHENTARLEVSGILQGDDTLIDSRFKEKFKRALKYQQFVTMPVCVCVVEHSTPKAEVRVRHA